MTLEEAIEHAKEVSDEKKKEACSLYDAKAYEESRDCIWCSEEHKQLAEWLKELERLRKFKEKAGIVIEQLRADRDRLEKVLDDIRVEILEEKECAYADFEEYKVEYLGQNWEDALDSLPQDDFRYGMERCVEIIDEYRKVDE